MFIQDFYLGLDGKQRVIGVLGAAGAFGPFSALLCAVAFLRRTDSVDTY
jgi:hypothetical protein